MMQSVKKTPTGEIAEREQTNVPVRNELLNYWGNMDRIFDELTRDMGSFFWNPPGVPVLRVHGPRMAMSGAGPKVDVKDEGSGYVLTAELPGMNKDNLDIEIEESTILIKANGGSENRKEDENYLLQERSTFSFTRQFRFPEKVVPDRSVGEMKEGVLTIQLPKKEPVPKPRKHRLELK